MSGNDAELVLHVLAISGSLRALSSNTALLRLATEAAPPGVVVTLYERLGELPHFNPDLDVGTPPEVVLDLRQRIGASHALLISSPEYAHGPPGVLKNALDWLVASVEFPGKPVVLLNTSPHAVHAQASLVETLTVMCATPDADARVTIPVARHEIDAEGRIASAELRAAVRQVLEALAHRVRTTREN
jgi:chromate reductase, NAD(P)H dehydrogenase (quinone)